MGIERCGARGFDFIFGQQFQELVPFPGPLAVEIVKDLRHGSPADILDQFGFLFWGRWTPFRLDGSERADGGNILLKFLFWAAITELIGFGDAIIVDVLRRLRAVWKFMVADLVAGCLLAGG